MNVVSSDHDFDLNFAILVSTTRPGKHFLIETEDEEDNAKAKSLHGDDYMKRGSPESRTLTQTKIVSIFFLFLQIYVLFQ